MKTYYDLTAKERKNYKKEFKKTPVGKEIYTGYILASILTLILFFSTDLLVSIDEDLAANLSICTGIFMLAVDFIYTLYININYTAWLKNKYDIKRW